MGHQIFARSALEQQVTLLKDLMQGGQDYHRLWLGAELLTSVLPEDEKVHRLEEAFGAEAEQHQPFLLAMGLAHEAAGDYPTARDYLLQALALDPHSHFAYYDLGWVQRQMGRHEDAASSFRRAISLEPQYVDAYNQLGITYFEGDDHARALTAFESAVAREPQNAHHYFNMGYMHELLGNYAAAVRAFAQAVHLDPKHQEAQAHLGVVQTACNTPELEALDGVPFVKGLSLEQRLLICQHLQPVAVAEGETVIRQGDVGDAFYIVQEGRLQVTIAGQRGEEISMGDLEKGGHFGEIALLEEGDRRRTATVRALTSAHLLTLSREHFEQVRAEIPAVAQNVVQTRNQRLQQDVRRTLEENQRRWHGGVTEEAPPADVAPAEDAADQGFSVLTAMVLPAASFTQALGTRTMMRFLREFYLEMLTVIGEHGVVRHYSGDRIVALFDLPQRAVEVGLAMHQAFRLLAERWRKESPLVPDLGVGIATGPLEMEANTLSGLPMSVSLGLSHLDRESSRLFTDDNTAQALADSPLGPRLTPLPQAVHLPGVGDALTVYQMDLSELSA
ncbi:MAG: tetratricopeptide repeat protein [Chloroflexi bacterium]|nr:tetratricopeptide repeat protein [Chloroflexota bacterium]